MFQLNRIYQAGGRQIWGTWGTEAPRGPAVGLLVLRDSVRLFDQQTLISHSPGGWKPRVEVPARSAKGQGHSVKMNSVHKPPPTPPKGPPPPSRALGLGFQHMDLGDTKIRSVARKNAVRWC